MSARLRMLFLSIMLITDGLAGRAFADKDVILADRIASPEFLAKLVTQLDILKEKCVSYWYINKMMAQQKHEEFVNLGFDKVDPLVFLRFLEKELDAAAKDFVAGRIDREWCEEAKSTVILIFPEMFRE